jgi:glutamate racemase
MPEQTCGAPTVPFTIVVTDSGLGGLAVMAELDRQLRARSSVGPVRLVFCNALFDEHSGYNRLSGLAQKAALFDQALQDMTAYAPDLIVIACNTLSVVYPHTQFSQTTTIPVMGIVEAGIEAIRAHVPAAAPAWLVLFATPTTLAQGIHKQRLARRLPAARLIEQPCPELVRVIEAGDRSGIRTLIGQYVTQAVQAVRANPDWPALPVYASLQCTHFGYYQEEFRRAFQQAGAPAATLIDPAAALVHRLLVFLTEPVQGSSDQRTALSLECVSKVPIDQRGIAALTPKLAALSPAVAHALRHYRQTID